MCALKSILVTSLCLLLMLVLDEHSATGSTTATGDDICINRTRSTSSTHSLHRQKRLLYFTRDRRLTFPPGTGLFLTPTFSIPFIRNMPHGYDTGMTISVPFKLDFDALGWGSEENPYGLRPEFGLFRKKRSLDINPFGSTVHMYGVFIEIIDNLGYPGKLCLQRAICELKEGPLTENYGWMKNIIEWALTPSINSPRKQNLTEYLEAEELGERMDCSRYYGCSLTIFSTPAEHKQKSTMRHRKPSGGSNEELTNEINDGKPSKCMQKQNSKQHIKQKLEREKLQRKYEKENMQSKLEDEMRNHDFKTDRSKYSKYTTKGKSEIGTENPQTKQNEGNIDGMLSKDDTKDNISNENDGAKAVKNTNIDEKWMHNNITVESLAHQTRMKKRLDKIQAIAMLQSFKKVIR